MGNTVGRLSKVDPTKLAYIAGFLDGDGSVMLQLHRREPGKDRFRVKTTICFYQDNRYRKEVEDIKAILGCGYVYTRRDHICELKIEGFQRVFEVIKALKPYLKFKRRQASLMLELIPKLQQCSVLKEEAVVWIRKMREYNYISHHRTTLDDVPVTTDI